MPLPPKSSATAEKIVHSAAQLFARQGYHGTSTREIARLAGVSENTLFRHFDHKEDLFWKALLSRTNGLRFRRDLQEGIARCDPPEVVLPKIFEFLAETTHYRPELLRLIAVAFLELNWKAEAFCQEHLSPLISSLCQYLATNIKRGTLRDLDPTMLTTALMMSALMHPGVSKLLGDDRAASSDSRETGRAHTRFWVDALSPRPVAVLREVAAAPAEAAL